MWLKKIPQGQTAVPEHKHTHSLDSSKHTQHTANTRARLETKKSLNHFFGTEHPTSRKLKTRSITNLNTICTLSSGKCRQSAQQTCMTQLFLASKKRENCVETGGKLQRDVPPFSIYSFLKSRERIINFFPLLHLLNIIIIDSLIYTNGIFFI